MAEGNRTTLVVAVAGIAATALVGLAGTTAAWLSARDDRHEQRALAHDQRTYDRRVSVYLDTIDYLEGHRALFKSLAEPPGLSYVDYPVTPYMRRHPNKVPYQVTPPARLTSRLRAFGSDSAFKTFQQVQSFSENVPESLNSEYPGPRFYLLRSDYRVQERDKNGTTSGPKPAFVRHFRAFEAQLNRFENLVHEEVG